MTTDRHAVLERGHGDRVRARLVLRGDAGRGHGALAVLVVGRRATTKVTHGRRRQRFRAGHRAPGLRRRSSGRVTSVGASADAPRGGGDQRVERRGRLPRHGPRGCRPPPSPGRASPSAARSATSPSGDSRPSRRRRCGGSTRAAPGVPTRRSSSVSCEHWTVRRPDRDQLRLRAEAGHARLRVRRPGRRGLATDAANRRRRNVPLRRSPSGAADRPYEVSPPTPTRANRQPPRPRDRGQPAGRAPTPGMPGWRPPMRGTSRGREVLRRRRGPRPRSWAVSQDAPVSRYLYAVTQRGLTLRDRRHLAHLPHDLHGRRPCRPSGSRACGSTGYGYDVAVTSWRAACGSSDRAPDRAGDPGQGALRARRHGVGDHPDPRPGRDAGRRQRLRPGRGREAVRDGRGRPGRPARGALRRRPGRRHHRVGRVAPDAGRRPGQGRGRHDGRRRRGRRPRRLPGLAASPRW